MSSIDFARLALQLALMLACAVTFGEIMRRFRQPAVVGEMFGGILLGPTLFGVLAPGAYDWLFAPGPVTVVRDAATKLGMLFFLFYAGLEVNLSDLRVLGKRAVSIGLVGTILPIAAGVGLVYALPRGFWGDLAGAHFFAFALFIGMNLANSANPVIARVLMELNLLNRPIGALIMSATVVDDLINWTLFAVILSQIAPATGSPAAGSLATSMLLIVALFVVVLGLGRWLGPAALRWLQPHVSWPSGFIAVTAVLVLLASSAFEAVGVHAYLGAFLAGVALGQGGEQHSAAHPTIGNFVMSFAPIYFVSMGLTTNFVQHFDWRLVTVVLAVACVSKIGSVLAGAWLARMPIDREVWAVGFGLNARGATGIILAGVGLSTGVIDARIYVAVVVMALVTSLMAGPAMSRLLRQHELPGLAGTHPTGGR